MKSGLCTHSMMIASHQLIDLLPSIYNKFWTAHFILANWRHNAFDGHAKLCPWIHF